MKCLPFNQSDDIYINMRLRRCIFASLSGMDTQASGFVWVKLGSQGVHGPGSNIGQVTLASNLYIYTLNFIERMRIE